MPCGSRRSARTSHSASRSEYKQFAEGEAPKVLRDLAEMFVSADGFIVVFGEYNHGIPPALKNLMDHFMEEYFWRPAAIVSYSGGSFGGVRAAAQLRSVLGEMGMVTIPTSQPFPHVGNAFTDDGEPTDPKTRER
ncbi:MAG TPA: NADPH-dependent FMN reductase [Candidatus Baltobacteraceae bacterium]|nr:NADPH-dependent FMN reductase [Candidatus Baltobacteraceae bacterium]